MLTTILTALVPILGQSTQPAATPAAPGPPTDLKVAFVGTPDSARSRAYASLIEQGFGSVVSLDRSSVTRVALEGIDVVVLDWNQQDRGDAHPLGSREEWDLPTVLLGSAGLNTAIHWDVRGGSG